MCHSVHEAKQCQPILIPILYSFHNSPRVHEGLVRIWSFLKCHQTVSYIVWSPPPTVGQEAVELICQNARKMRQNAAMSLWPLLTTKMKLICMEVLKKMTFSQKTFLTLSMVTLANRGHKTASRAEPIFWGQTDLTQWCHISPISWGNSGYINPYAKYNKCWCWINSTA